MDSRSASILQNLRIVCLSSLLHHEDHDPSRLNRLRENIASEGVQANPVIVSPVSDEASDGRFLILDGAHRVHALQSLGCSLALVQVVETPPKPESWNHIVPGLDPEVPVSEPRFSPLTSSPESDWVSTVRMGNGLPDTMLYASGGGLEGTVAALRSIQSLYPKDVSVTRAEYREGIPQHLEDDEVEVSYRAFSVPELVEVAECGEVLPAGITRFRIPERILGVRFPLESLKTDDARFAASTLEQKIEKSIRENRIRRYEEPVVLFE